MTASLQQLTWLASAPFRAQHQLVSGRLSRAPPRRGRTTARVFPPPFGRRHSLLGHPFPPGVPPLLRSAYRQPQLADHDGVSVFRTRETRPGPGALYTPGTAVPAQARVHPVPAACRLARPVPVTPVSPPVPGCLSHEASARVHWHSPLPAIPSPVAPGRNGSPRAFPRASHPAGQDPAAHAGAGTGLRHWPGITPSPSATSYGVSTHHERLHVATHLQGVLSNRELEASQLPFSQVRGHLSR